MNSKMKKLFPLVLLGMFTTASGGDCGGSGGCSSSAPCPVESIQPGVWDYQRDVNGGWSAGGQTVLWQLTFSEAGKVTLCCGKIFEDDPDFGITVVWRYTGNQIDALYERSGNSVTFHFDDLMDPRRTSFSGQLVSESRAQGNGWVAELCDLIARNCGG